jgi:SMI1 / KNR4 family (SUKH-1)
MSKTLIILTLLTAAIFGVVARQSIPGEASRTQEKQMSTPDWGPWLREWSRDLLNYIDPRRYHGPVDKEMIASGWLGYPGATEDQISNLEARLGKTLPPSYRAFLKASNGFQQPGMFVPRLLTVDEIEWFRVKSLDTIDMWKSNGLEDLTNALAISPFDEDVYLLNPQVVTADGEWEALDFSPGQASCDHYPSFWELMQAKRKTFLNVMESIANGIKPDDDLQIIVARFPDLIKYIDREIQSSLKFQERYREELNQFLELEALRQEATRPVDVQGSEKNSNQSKRLIAVIRPASPPPANPQPIIIDGHTVIAPVPSPANIRERLEQQLNHATAVVEGMTSAKPRVSEVAVKSNQPEVITHQLRSLMHEWTAKYLELMRNRTGNSRQDHETGLHEGQSRVAGAIRTYLNEPPAISWDDLKTRAITTTAVVYSSRESASANVVIIVNIDGVVTRAYSFGGDEGLGRAAAQTLKQWRFRPYKVNGHTVDKSCEISVRLVDDKIELLPTASK